MKSIMILTATAIAVVTCAACDRGQASQTQTTSAPASSAQSAADQAPPSATVPVALDPPYTETVGLKKDPALSQDPPPRDDSAGKVGVGTSKGVTRDGGTMAPMGANGTKPR